MPLPTVPPPKPDPPEVFAQKVLDMTLKHRDHWRGWREEEDGLHCVVDGVLCLPSPAYMIEHGRFDPE